MISTMWSTHLKLIYLLTITSVDITFANSECLSLDLTVTQPLPSMVNCGTKSYYLGTFYKTNFHGAMAFCKYHGMQSASIESKEEDTCLINYIKSNGHYKDNFWLSGTDLVQEGEYVWMSNGRPFKYANWHRPGPNNDCTGGECEDCAGLWYHQGVLKFNDFKCSLSLFFICEI